MKPATDTLNSLLRGELAAAETYEQALENFDGEVGASELRRIHSEHLDAAKLLRGHILEHGGVPEESSGAWGAFASAVEGTAKLFGNTAALKALKEGEQSGISSYEDVLQHDESLPLDCKSLVSGKLLPKCRAHVPVLDRLMAAQ